MAARCDYNEETRLRLCLRRYPLGKEKVVKSRGSIVRVNPLKDSLVMLLTTRPYYDDNDNMTIHKRDVKRASLYIPLALATKMQESAKKHRRSFNQEILWLVEQSLAMPTDKGVKDIG